MGYKYSREEIMEAALEASVEEGVGGLTFGRVAQRMGIADRTVVYYFPTKQALIEAVLHAHSARLQEVLGRAFKTSADDFYGIVRAAWPLISSEDAEPVMRLFFEMMGLAVRGVEPFAQVVPAALHAWVESLAPKFNLPLDERRGEGEAAVAVIDGLLLLHFTVGPETSARAFERLMR